MVAGQGRDHGIAPGQWVVGQEQHRLATDRHLDGADHRALAGQLGRVAALQGLGPLQPHADAVGLGSDAPGLAGQRLQRLGGEPVGARPQDHVQGHGLSGARQGRACASPRVHGAQLLRRHCLPHHHPLPGMHSLRADQGQGVGGATAQHRGHAPTTAHGDIAAHPGLDGAQLQGVAIVQGHRLVAGHLPAVSVGTAHAQRDLGPAHGQRAGPVGTQHQLAQHVLQHRGVHRVADPAVGLAHGALVQGARRRDPQARHAVAAAVLENALQPRTHKFDSCLRRCIKGWRLIGCR